MEQIESLEMQIGDLHHAFERAVETRTKQNAVYAKGVLGAYRLSLYEVVNRNSFLDWRRKTERTQVFDQYILPIALLKSPVQMLVKREPVANFEEYTEKMLREAIDNYENYSVIDKISRDLAFDEKYHIILNMFNYVWNNNSPESPIYISGTEHRDP